MSASLSQVDSVQKVNDIEESSLSLKIDELVGVDEEKHR